MNPYPKKWTTEDELFFLARIGGWNNDRKTVDPSIRRYFLEKYLTSMANRVEWEDVNKNIIENYVTSELAK